MGRGFRKKKRSRVGRNFQVVVPDLISPEKRIEEKQALDELHRITSRAASVSLKCFSDATQPLPLYIRNGGVYSKSINSSPMMRNNDFETRLHGASGSPGRLKLGDSPADILICDANISMGDASMSSGVNSAAYSRETSQLAPSPPRQETPLLEQNPFFVLRNGENVKEVTEELMLTSTHHVLRKRSVPGGWNKELFVQKPRKKYDKDLERKNMISAGKGGRRSRRRKVKKEVVSHAYDHDEASQFVYQTYPVQPKKRRENPVAPNPRVPKKTKKTNRVQAPNANVSNEREVIDLLASDDDDMIPQFNGAPAMPDYIARLMKNEIPSSRSKAINQNLASLLSSLNSNIGSSPNYANLLNSFNKSTESGNVIPQAPNAVAPNKQNKHLGKLSGFRTDKKSSRAIPVISLD